MFQTEVTHYKKIYISGKVLISLLVTNSEKCDKLDLVSRKVCVSGLIKNNINLMLTVCRTDTVLNFILLTTHFEKACLLPTNSG